MPSRNLLAEIQSGDLLFLRGRGFWSRAIRLRSQSAFSHVGIAIRLPWSYRIWVIEALEGKGVRLVPIDEWLDWRIDFDWYELVQLDRDALLAEALEHVGDDYADARQFARSFSLLWSRIARRLHLRADTDRRRWFCSELVATALKAGGAKLHAAPAKLMPGDLALLSCVRHRARIFPPVARSLRD